MTYANTSDSRRTLSRGVLLSAVALGALTVFSGGCGGESAASFPDGADAAAGAAGGGSGGSSGASGTGGTAGNPDDGGGTGGDAGAGACPEDQKGCSSECVSKTDPEHGCAAVSCDACVLPHATATCAIGGTCAVEACDAGFADCDGDPSNGCEGNVDNDPANCGACNNECTAPSGTPECKQGKCGVSACDDGKGDCDANPANGCEADFGTSMGNCGFCGNACATPYATPKCDEGVCKVDACDAGRGNCDGNDSNGCEVDLLTALDSCGACANACPVPAHAGATCEAGQCGMSCDGEFADCNEDPADGCEVSLASDATNCGVCGTVCTVANGTPQCVSGACQVGSCATGWGDCDVQVDNGCELDLLVSLDSCGACGNVCPHPPNSTPLCTTGSCGIECTASYANCDGNVANGCEVGLSTDAQNCGACGAVCVTPNAVPACQASVCQVGTCTAGYANCNGAPADGCEVNLGTSLTNCGACGTVCAVANGTPACQAGSCQVASCDPGFANCNNQPADGCEISTATSLTNCGACGAVCNLANAAPACVGGTCQVASCAGGFDDCNALPADGCEVNVKTSLANCGSCGAVCDVPQATESCTAGACTLGACDTGWQNCDGDTANGCEINTMNDVAHCGGCATACSFAHAQSVCLSSVCGIFQCDAGWGNCDAALANGCETSLQTVTSCGSCWNPCSFPHAAASCSAGQCALGACNAGYADCDGLAGNGCEVQVTNDATNCGSCGHSCLGGACTTAKCEPVILAVGQNNPWAIATDGVHVYWDNRNAAGTVQRIPTQGGAPLLIASNLSSPDGLAINATRVYWANFGAGTIQSAALGGGAVTTIATVTGTGPAGVALTDTHVYWTEWTAGSVRRALLGGGAPQSVSNAGNTAPHRIATDGTYVWWANFGSNAVRRAPTGGGAVTDIATGQANPTGVAIDNAYVYWTNQLNGTVVRSPLAGGPTTVVATGQSKPTGIAVDGTHVYWTDSVAAGTVQRAPKAGGVVETLAANQGVPVYIALDTGSLYWTNSAGGTVVRLAK